jgi:hypothetical protein
MRLSFPTLSLALLSLTACDEPRHEAPAAAASSSALVAAATAVTTTSSTTQAPSKRVMPPRPVPLGSSGPIQPSAPAEQQMMAIQYTLGMLATSPTEPSVNKTYIDELAKKLAVAVRTADKGKTPPDPVVVEKGGRKIRVEMGSGCTDKVPTNLIVGRAGSSLRAAYDAGLMVISCHDSRWECHQSTRDPEDVLCHASPRR